MKLLKSLSFVCLMFWAINAFASQCFFIGDSYICVPAIDATSINWTSLNHNIQGNSINWTALTSEIQAANINWNSLSRNIQTSGVNWTSVKNLEIQQYGVNWSSIPNYSEGKTLKARSGATYGINWE